MKTNPRRPSGTGAARKRAAARQPAPGPAPKPPSHDQLQNRREFGDCSTLWDNDLTDPERDAWHRAVRLIPRPKGLTPTGRRHPRITGQKLFIKVNSLRLAFGLELLRLPPFTQPFHPNPVGQLSITYAGARLVLQLAVASPPAGPILLYASAPCNPGVSVFPKCRRLGLLPEPVAGLSDITSLYRAKFGLPPAGKRIFVRTRYLDEYLSKLFNRTRALVPAPPARNGHAPKPPFR